MILKGKSVICGCHSEFSMGILIFFMGGGSGSSGGHFGRAEIGKGFIFKSALGGRDAEGGLVGAGLELAWSWPGAGLVSSWRLIGKIYQAIRLLCLMRFFYGGVAWSIVACYGSESSL